MAARFERDKRVERDCSAAFTLIEVLIAVVILSMGIVLILQGLHGAIGVWDGSVDRLRSVMLVREKLEEIALASTSGEGAAPAQGDGRFDPPFQRYRWAVEVELGKQPGRSGGTAADAGSLYLVRCTVQREQNDREFSATTLIFVPPKPPLKQEAGAAL